MSYVARTMEGALSLKENMSDDEKRNLECIVFELNKHCSFTNDISIDNNFIYCDSHGYFRYEGYEAEEQLKKLIPFVKTEEYISFIGEDMSLWRFVFTEYGYGIREEFGKIVWS